MYSGLLTYDMHYTAVTEDWFSPGSADLTNIRGKLSEDTVSSVYECYARR